MQPVAIGGFHDHIIGVPGRMGILDERLVFVPDIPGKAQLLLNSVLLCPHFNAGGAQQMPDVRKTDPDSGTNLNYFLIITGY